MCKVAARLWGQKYKCCNPGLSSRPINCLIWYNLLLVPSNTLVYGSRLELNPSWSNKKIRVMLNEVSVQPNMVRFEPRTSWIVQCQLHKLPPKKIIFNSNFFVQVPFEEFSNTPSFFINQKFVLWTEALKNLTDYIPNPGSIVWWAFTVFIITYPWSRLQLALQTL